MTSLPTIDKQFDLDQNPFDVSGLMTVTRINMSASLIFAKMLQLTIDNEADYLNIALTVLEQMIALKRADANGRIIINAGVATGGKDKGKRVHSVELRVIVKKEVELLDIYSKS